MQTDIWKHLFNIHPGEVCNFSVFCLSSGKYCKFYLVWLPLAYKLKTKKPKNPTTNQTQIFKCGGIQTECWISSWQAVGWFGAWIKKMAAPREGDRVVRSDGLGGLGQVHPVKISCISWQKCTNHGSFSWFCCRDPGWMSTLRSRFRNPGWFGRAGARGGWAWGQEVTAQLSFVQGSASDKWNWLCWVWNRSLMQWLPCESLWDGTCVSESQQSHQECEASVQSFPEDWNDCKQPQAGSRNRAETTQKGGKTSHLCPCCCEQFWAAFTDVDVR